MKFLYVGFVSVLFLGCLPKAHPKNADKNTKGETQEDSANNQADNSSPKQNKETIVEESKNEQKNPDENTNPPSVENPVAPPMDKTPKVCDLGDFTVEGEYHLKKNESCDEFVFKKILVKNGGVLNIGPGVRLVTGEKAARFAAEPLGNVFVQGSEDKRVFIGHLLDKASLNVSLGGTALLHFLDLRNVTLTFWGIQEVSLHSLKIDNAESEFFNGHSALGIRNAKLTRFSDVSILNHRGTPMHVTLRSLSSLPPTEKNALEINSPDHAWIDLYNGLSSANDAENDNFLPNLNYPFHVKNSLSFTGKSFVIEPGVKLRLCSSCMLYSWADQLLLGQIQQAPVEITGNNGQDWIGMLIYEKTRIFSVHNTIFKDTRGTLRGATSCPASAMIFEGGTQVDLKASTFSTRSGELMALDSSVTLAIEPFSVRLEGGGFYTKDSFNPKTEWSISKLNESQVIEKKTCPSEL